MSFTVTMPKLSPTMEEGTIVKWNYKEGDKVEAGSVLLEITTDKATVEHNALDAGYLRKILVEEGKSAKVNQPIAVFTESENEPIEEEQKAPQKEEKQQVEEKPVAKEEKQESVSVSQPSFIPYPPLEEYDFTFSNHVDRIKATPLAKKIAEEKGLDLSSVKGTGPNNRITSKDLDLAKSKSAAFSKKKIPTTMPGSYEEEPISNIRKVIGTRLQRSKSFIPHYYIRQEVCVDALVKIREELKEVGVYLTYNDFILKACALSLREHPNINTGFNSQTQSIVHFKTIDICVAVTIEGGLITPIVRCADYKSLEEISFEVKALAKKAKEQKLKPEEFQGGSFTISNLGMFAIDDFIAVINPPQSAILAVGGIVKKPAVREDQIVVSNRLTLTLSLDHRVIDGAQGAQFIKSVQKFLERPSSLLL